MNTVTKIRVKLGFDVLIDTDDYERVSKHKWRVKRTGQKDKTYIASSQWKGKTIYLHRFIMNCPEGKEVDHVDCNSFDNRKVNLEVVPLKVNRSRAMRGKNRAIRKK